MKILVAIEQSTYSSKALEQAIEMAKEKGAELTALTVAETIHGIEEIYTADDIKQKLMEQATATLEKAKQAAQAKGIALNTLIVGSDTPAESIIDAATKAGSNLIIMGSRGKKGIARFVLGSVASKVVAYAPCSVLVVR